MTKSTYTDNYARLIKFLVDARKERGITQAQLAGCIAKPQSFIAKIENKERRLDLVEFLELCKHLHTNPMPIIESLIETNSSNIE